MKWPIALHPPLQFRAEEWVHFHDAAEAVATALKVSTGVAERRLREQCASGDVRSIRYEAIDDEGEIMQLIDSPQPIKPREWDQDQIDFTAVQGDNDEAIWMYVDVSKDDVAHWLVGEGLMAVAAGQKAKGGKTPRIKDHLAAMFPEGVPDPAHCVRKELQGRLLKADPTLAPLDLKTLKAAIDEYNAGKR
jgi:hypothetical protein